MNILQINTVDEKGGAAKVAMRIHRKLLTRNFNSNMIVGKKYSNEKTILSLRKNGVVSRIVRYIKNIVEEFTGYQYHFQDGINKLDRIEMYRDADVVHIHNLHGGYINFNIIEQIAKNKPVVLTLHDMWPFTGHCTHSKDCDRWIHGCGNCPILMDYPKIRIDKTKLLHKKKSEIYKSIKNNLVITAPSKWMSDKASASILNGSKIVKISNLVDLDVFLPFPKDEIRIKYKLPLDKFIIIFTGGWAKNPNKGLSLIYSAINNIKRKKDIFMLTIGGDRSYAIFEDGIQGYNFKFTNDEYLLAQYYSMGNIYVLSSEVENAPLVICESLACGTPVVAFSIGGVLEMINHKVNGYLAKAGSCESLQDGIEYFMNMDITNKIDAQKKSREQAIMNFNSESIIEEYIKLYTSIVNDD